MPSAQAETEAIVLLGRTSGEDIVLQWTEPVPPADEYLVYRGVGNETPVPIASTGQTNYTDAARGNGTVYVYYVVALDDGQEVAKSNEVRLGGGGGCVFPYTLEPGPASVPVPNFVVVDMDHPIDTVIALQQGGLAGVGYVMCTINDITAVGILHEGSLPVRIAP